LKWLEAQSEIKGSVVTSIPDYSEIGMKPDEYKVWFLSTATSIFRKLNPSAFIIFYQSDAKIIQNKQCVEWLDKGFLCQLAAYQTGFRQLWHKIMLFKDVVGQPRLGRPGYSHMLCFGNVGFPTDVKQTPSHVLIDVCERGFMSWPKAMGLNACKMACAFLKSQGTTTVVDPFCGKGTAMAIANEMNMNAIGVDISPKRCRTAKTITLAELEAEESECRPADRTSPAKENATSSVGFPNRVEHLAVVVVWHV